MDAAIEHIWRFWIDVAEPDKTAERRLDVPAGASEPIVEVEVAERGVQIVAPQQADDAAAKPDTLLIAGGTLDQPANLGDFVYPLGDSLAPVARCGFWIGRFLVGILGVGGKGDGGLEGEGADCEQPRDTQVRNKLLNENHGLGRCLPAITIETPPRFERLQR